MMIEEVFVLSSFLSQAYYYFSLTFSFISFSLFFLLSLSSSTSSSSSSLYLCAAQDAVLGRVVRMLLGWDLQHCGDHVRVRLQSGPNILCNLRRKKKERDERGNEIK